MTRSEILRFALRAAGDWSLVPVLRDALLEFPETSALLEEKIAFAAKLAATEHRNYFVAMEPRMLSPQWRATHFDHEVFAVYEFDRRRYEDLAAAVESLREQHHEPVVPIYGARAR